MAKDYASSFSGAACMSAFLTSTSEYLFRKYSLAAVGDVMLENGSADSLVSPGAGLVATSEV